MRFVTFEHLNRAIGKNLHRIPADVDLVVGIPRSGLMVASLIALQRNLPLTDIEGLATGKLKAAGSTRRRSNWAASVAEAQHILVVDDSISTGAALKEARETIDSLGLAAKFTYAAPFALPTNFKKVDLYFEVINHPRLFEWNYMHHWAMAHACVDIDGVLCADPSFIDNDDGPRYERFLREAPPRLLPTKPVGMVVTSRLEKYRSLTETWLARHGVEYERLAMLEGVTAAERRRGGMHAQFKAEVYQQSPHALFIESNLEQAIDICRIAQRPVYSIEQSRLIEPAGVSAAMATLVRDWRITARQVVKKLLARR